MKQASELFAEQFVQMRERCLSLAADFDRLARAPGGLAAIASEPRFVALRQALAIAGDAADSRARRVLELLSDATPVAR